MFWCVFLTLVFSNNKELDAVQYAEKEKLKKEQEEIVAEFEWVKADLSSRLEQANQEVNSI